MDVDALAKTKGGKKGGKAKDKGGKSRKFEGNCFWCGANGHIERRLLGSRKFPSPREGLIRSRRRQRRQRQEGSVVP